MLVATINPATLAASTDAELDAGLRRLYALHLDAGREQKPIVHVDVMAVLGEMSRRLDVWLAERG